MYRTIVAAILLLAITVMPLSAAERHIMESRVPEDQREAARSLASPLTDSPEIVVQGKALYEGKAGCATCHGLKATAAGRALMIWIPRRAIFAITDSGATARKARFSGRSSMGRRVRR